MTVIMATIIGEREKEFEAIFGTACVPITSGIATWRTFAPGDEREVFIVDHQALRPEQYEALVEHLMGMYNFGFTRAFIERRLNQVGHSIPASDCVLSVFDPPRLT